MIGPFVYEAGAFSAELQPPYSTLIAQAMREILVVLDDPGDMPAFVAAATSLENHREAPEEHSLDYLLPAMSSDPQDATGLRALTEDFLRAEKSARLRKVCAHIERTEALGIQEVSFDADKVWDWLGALNDVRLGLAGELQIASDDDVEQIAKIASEKPNGTRQQSASAIYMILTWWQDSLVFALNSQGGSN